MARQKKITACDCETDPFKYGRVPRPFIWGFYDGKDFSVFNTTEEFVKHVIDKPIIIYAHNGGKFDFHYLLSFVGETRAQIINGRIISMMLGEAELVDSYAAVPESLKRIKKREIEMWKLEESVRKEHMKEIIYYLEGDCVYLHELMTTYREQAGTRKTIASNALAYAKKLGLEPGTTNHAFDSDFRPFYFGGRTQCFQPGTFKNINVFDIHSAYPFAMTHDHPSGAARNFRSTLKLMEKEEIQRAFIHLKCFSNGAFPIRTNGAQGLNFPIGEGEFKVSGWEYLTAKELGLIKNEEILQVRLCEGTINFTPYVNYWYNYKQNHPKKDFPIEYTIGKILLNSLYGKMAQNPARYFDYKIVEPGTPLPCNDPIPDNDDKICRVCNFLLEEHGWTRYVEYEGKTFHRRASLWKYEFRYGAEWKSKPLYKNVATGASITGFTRAHLLRAIHTLGVEHVIYCDTDSIMCDENADTNALPQSDKLGDWEWEIKNAPLAHFAGKKMYAIDLGNNEKCNCGSPDGCKRHKVVTKGGRLTFKDMDTLANGGEVIYHQEAPSFSISNGEIFFPTRKFRATADLAKAKRI